MLHVPIHESRGAARPRHAFFSCDEGAPLASTWELFYFPGDARPAAAGGQVTVVVVPGANDWWFACCSD